MGRPQRPQKRRVRPRRQVRVAGAVLRWGAVWGLVAPAVLSGLGVATRGLIDPLEASQLGWLADSAATLAAQSIALGLVCVLLAVVLRRLVAGVVALAAVLVLAVALLDVERAAAVPASSAEGPVVSVLAVNAWSSGAEGAAQLEAMLGSGADLIMLNEVSGSLLEALRTDLRVRETYPYFRLPDRAGPGFRFVLSRHPIGRGDDGFGFLWPEIEASLGYHGMRVLRVELPEGPIVFAGIQFRSPRSAERWAIGNAQALDTARGLRLIADRTRLPIIVAGDFNASPLGARSRAMAQAAGLLRVKPALRAGGTYPAALPPALGVPIDGAMVSPGVRVISYRLLDMPGSDHRAALVVLELPGQAAPSSP